ncbi:hypothetical protein KJS94_10065 [Flavihumibacter rivuli]|uniref:hypothetical protein n=1 Tax=Flavihumibacter rivuli TaxID=2838156 RepID=UPI001BDF1824|nr:hypothetical protein [Flavihumibacter rivuli]ULQ54982.1 hypothetical protein KJS94_10065 [Flavihumibacter rivuli]
MKPNLNQTLLILAAILLASCTREKIVEVEKVPQTLWNEVKDFAYSQKRQLNVIPLNDSLAGFAGQEIFSVLNGNANQVVFNRGGYIGGSGLIARKPSLSPLLIVYPYREFVSIKAVKNPVLGSSAAGVNGISVDSDFIEFVSPFLSFNQAVPIAGKRYLVLPYRSKQTTQNKQFAFLARVDIDSSGGDHDLSIGAVKKVEFNSGDGNLALTNYYNLQAIDEQFWICFNERIYRMDTTGQQQEIAAPIYTFSEMFKAGGKLVGVNPNGRFYASSDGGINWQLLSDTNETIWGFINFTEVDGRVFATYLDQVFDFKLLANGFDVKELENDGLQRNAINAITRAGSRYYVSTESGVFSADTAKLKLKAN